jgi:protein-tyrosine phosphatase
MTPKGPIPDSYWLIDGKLLAGEYAGTSDVATTRAKLAKFLDAGIRTFVNLTERNEWLTKYDAVLGELSAERGLETKHIRHEIRDLGIPRDTAQMTKILTTIQEEIAAGRPVYVHCWGGVGRTGTVIGCWLVEQGLSGAAAIDRIAALRKTTPDGFKRSPETDEQRRYICEWSSEETRRPAADDRR